MQTSGSDARIVAGAMSGTSADGVDVALVRITGRGLGMSAELLHHHARPYPASLRAAIFAVRGSGQVSLAELANLGRDITLEYVAAIRSSLVEANLKPSDLAAIAAHGQTLYHSPPNTIQWLDPALIAVEVGCKVVSDFRRADCAAGGQGAPLVPFADYLLYRHPIKNRVLLNIGGIANLTYLPAGGTVDQLIAFDTGPGNCVSDWLCRQHDRDGPGYDPQGTTALAGKAVFATAFAMARTAFVFAAPPKSTDGPAMIQAFQEAADFVPKGEFPFEDQLATACLATAYCISMSLDLLFKRLQITRVDEVLVSGGGVENRCMMAMLKEALLERQAGSVVSLGHEATAKEAIAFALLGAATLDGEPSNVPSCTGAKRAVVLGSVTPRP